jgi:hypothetical protein
MEADANGPVFNNEFPIAISLETIHPVDALGQPSS